MGLGDRDTILDHTHYVQLDRLEFIRRQPTRLTQDRVLDSDLADIVDPGRCKDALSCLVMDLGELGEMTPREGSSTSLASPPVTDTTLGAGTG